MTLSELKTRLSLRAVLAHYALTPDKNSRLNCPWHKDKTPSLQLYFQTNSWTCFSSACQAGSGDAIEFCCKMEGSKAQGIAVAKKLVGAAIAEAAEEAKWLESRVKESDRLAILSKTWLEARIAYDRSAKAQAYAEKRALQGIEIGFVPARLGAKWSEAEKANAQKMGLLNESGNPVMKGCLLFALRNLGGEIVGLYGRKVDGPGHYYLKGEIEGLFPHWPHKLTRQLILTESVIDAASLQSAVGSEQVGVVALYGTNGFKETHQRMITTWYPEIAEIVLCFDGDDAGRAAVQKYSKLLGALRPDVRISVVDLPEGEDVNSMAVGHEAAVFGELLDQRKTLQSPEKLSSSPSPRLSVQEKKSERECESEKEPPALDTSDPERLVFQTESLAITIWGGIDAQVMSRLKVNLQLKQKNGYGSYREDVNLYSHRQTKALVQDASEALAVSSSSLQAAVDELTEALELYRLERREQERLDQKPPKIELSPAQVAAAMKLLRSPELVKQTIALISQSGLVGERKNGLLLFFVYLTRMSKEPLHAIIQGKSGSGKTYLQSKIGGLIPEEAVQMVTGLTENTLYYADKYYFKHKVLIIEDLDGTYAALYPLREFMSKGSLTKLTTDKDAKGNNVQRKLHVEGPVCVSGATTSAQIYEDNANRSYLLEVDESAQHAEAVMNYQRRDKAGQIDTMSQAAAREALKNAQRMLKSVKVINPYATSLRIPSAVFKPLRTNMHYLRLIEAITFYHQHQRHWHKDKNGELYIKTSLEDIAWANWLVKDSLLRKADELNGRLRQFFERLKTQLEGSKGSFFAKDIRQSLRIHPQSLHRNLRQLEKLGLVQQVGYNRKTGFEYEITIWDDYEKLKDGINILDRILQELRDKEQGNQGGENEGNQDAA